MHRWSVRAAFIAWAFVGCVDRKDDPAAPAACEAFIDTRCKRAVVCVAEAVAKLQRTLPATAVVAADALITYEQCVATERVARKCNKAVLISPPWRNICLEKMATDCSSFVKPAFFPQTLASRAHCSAGAPGMAGAAGMAGTENVGGGGGAASGGVASGGVASGGIAGAAGMAGGGMVEAIPAPLYCPKGMAVAEVKFKAAIINQPGVDGPPECTPAFGFKD